MKISHFAGIMAAAAIIITGCTGQKDFSGEWAEKTAERIVATFTPDGDGYNVTIGWREEGLAQYETWQMKATREGKDELTYSGGVYTIRQYPETGDSSFTEETVYSDGTGKFSFNKDGDIVWTDDKDPNGEKTIFMKAAFGN